MSKNRMVKTDFWLDEYIESLSIKERYLFLYFLTGPQSNIAGMFRTTVKKISGDTDLTKPEIIKILDKFKSDNKVYFIDGHIIMVNFLKHQSPSGTMRKGIIDIIGKLSILVHRFIKSNNTDIYDRLSIGYTEAIHRINRNIDNNINNNISINKHIADFVPETPPEEKKPKKPETPFGVIYPDWLNIELWNKFLDLRKTLKKPFKTDQGITGAINKLKKLMDAGYTQEDIINNTLDGEWQSFYEPKKITGNGTPKPTTYAQCQDAERREKIRMLNELRDRREQDEANQKQIGDR
jgi:predicted DNA-binding ArsR family transcriptional regulator